RLIKTPMLTTIHGFSSQKIIPVYKKYNPTSHYVSISNADRSPELEYLATVYNGINTDQFEFNPEPGDYLLYFGRIHHDKGTAEAIDIAKKSGRKLIIAGIIQDEHYYKEKIEPRLDEQIVYIGHAGPEKRNELLGNALALLHPINFNEPFGLSVAEAMLCGTPVIAFNKGAMPELIKHGKTGYLVNHVNEAAKAVGQLGMINRIDCHQWALSQFSAEKMVDDYIKLYRKILS
ncbi:MAG: glycosyltransferase family 4 protein, partial [Mucilaginibacter sp.]